MVSASARRQQIAFVCQRGRSVRRACALLRVARSTVGYQSKLTQRDAPAVAVMRELALQYPRYGYRRIQVFMGRRGHAMRTDRAYRLWRLHRLQVPVKKPRRRVASSRPRPLPATAVGHVWVYDFVFDRCANGQQLKCLTVIDEFTHECLAIDVAGSIRSGRVIEVLGRLVSVHGSPKHLRSDNGPEFVSRAVLNGLPHSTSTARTSTQESLGRMAPTNHSMESSGTNVSRWSGSEIESMRRSQSNTSGVSTTRSDLTRVSGS